MIFYLRADRATQEQKVFPTFCFPLLNKPCHVGKAFQHCANMNLPLKR